MGIADGHVYELTVKTLGLSKVGFLLNVMLSKGSLCLSAILLLLLLTHNGGAWCQVIVWACLASFQADKNPD